MLKVVSQKFWQNWSGESIWVSGFQGAALELRGPRTTRWRRKLWMSLQACGNQGSPTVLRIVSFKNTGTEGSPLQSGPPQVFLSSRNWQMQMEEKDRRDSLWQRQLRIPLWAHVKICGRRVVNPLVGISSCLVRDVGTWNHCNLSTDATVKWRTGERPHIQAVCNDPNQEKAGSQWWQAKWETMKISCEWLCCQECLRLWGCWLSIHFYSEVPRMGLGWGAGPLPGSFWRRSLHCVYVSLPMGFPGSSMVKKQPANAGDTGSIPGLGRSPGRENGCPFWYSCLQNPKDRRTWTQLSTWAYVYTYITQLYFFKLLWQVIEIVSLEIHPFFSHALVEMLPLDSEVTSLPPPSITPPFLVSSHFFGTSISSLISLLSSPSCLSTLFFFFLNFNLDWLSGCVRKLCVQVCHQQWLGLLPISWS